MNGIIEPLPGLLDDPQFQITDLPALTDFQIAPLRNPAPARHGNVPLPLEPGAGNILNNTQAAKSLSGDLSGKRRAPKITPNDVLLARESKKPHLAISELLEDNDGQDIAPTQLPSFISLSVVEKSPVQAPVALEHPHLQKRLRGDEDSNEHISLDLIRRLPRPAQKDGRQNRPAPMLPAMVTGLHEPPPSAALLPSIDVDSRPGISRSNTSSKIHVKDMLTQCDQHTSALPTATPSGQPDLDLAVSKEYSGAHGASFHEVVPVKADTTSTQATWKDNKPRRARRKWSENETKDLLAGVRKYGVGKWKQILDDPSFSFSDRSSVDLKDRYRVCANNDSAPKLDTLPVSTPSSMELSFGAEVPGAAQAAASSDNCAAPSTSLMDAGRPSKRRRKRRAWTALEDANLLKGVAKHGFQWTAIHDDAELDLQHRRATDLRDRIRTKYPDGYKHAETAPLRSEMKKADKAGAQSSPGSVVGLGNSSTTPTGSSATATPPHSTAAAFTRSTSTTVLHIQVANERPKPSASASSASMTMLIHTTDTDKDRDTARDKDKDRNGDKPGDRDQQPGVTLPSFTLDVEDDMDWEDNRLPPLHEWDEIGM